MLLYNIPINQPGRPIGIAPASGWTFGAAVAASFGLHAIVVVAALMVIGQQRPGIDDAAAITVFVEPDPAPVATASEIPPQAVAELDPPKELALPDFAPPPPEAMAPPDFSAPPPPPPKPAQPVPRAAQPKPEPKRAAPPVAQPAPARPAATAPAESGSPAPAPVAVAGAPATVAPGWNALLAAWLGANRRYPDEARRRSEEGEVTVRFTVLPGGQVSEAAIVKGSGFAALDAAALRLLQGATLPAPGIEATRTVRIRFRLND
ncbi:TonB family protein [Reyranella sp.]|uniref:TonB family protein n=1 Tax=Reyranella sp. TaxID=1929291 RepID=UPI00272F83FC|nr:TonB family protein [Reyranella sp.]